MAKLIYLNIIHLNQYIVHNDGTPSSGTTSVNGIYTYTYNISSSGSYWSVVLSDKTSTDAVTETPCTYINEVSITSMSEMFRNSNAISIDVSSFDTSNVTKMMAMFYGTSATEIKGLENFNTSKVTTMYNMFGYVHITSIDVSSFDTSNVTVMTQMFSRSKINEIIGLENWNVRSVKQMNWMFDSINITSLDLSGFNTSNVTDMSQMFYGCQNLKTIYVGNNFTTDKVTSSTSMFNYAINLVGGNGTKYDSTKTDKTYARIDTADTPGYFTLKNN